MTNTISKHERNLSALMHASTLSKFFIPLGNFILPLVLWMANKKDLAYADYNGKQVLNFQLSLVLYSIAAGLISIPFFISFWPDSFNWNFSRLGDLISTNTLNMDLDLNGFGFGKLLWPAGIVGLIQASLFFINIIYSILGTLRTSEGAYFKYPITIPFI